MIISYSKEDSTMIIWKNDMTNVVVEVESDASK